MTFFDRPHYKISPSDLADWLDERAPASSWSVDGDPLLTALVDFPCPTDELSLQLRQLDRALFLHAPGDQDAFGQKTGWESIDALVVDTAVTQEEGSPKSRSLTLCWEDDVDEWVLYEDIGDPSIRSISHG